MNKIILANAVLFAAILALSTLFSGTIIKNFTDLLPKGLTIVALSPEAGLSALFLVGILVSILVYVPICAISVYFYIKPALYEHEIKFFQRNVLLGVFLFLIGAGFGFMSYLYFGIPFFIWADKLIGVANYWSISSLVSQILFASLAIGLCFLMPIALNNLIRYKFLDVNLLKKNRPWFALGLFLFIVIVPFLPNNPVEQLAVFLPIYGLYEITIFFNRGKNNIKPTSVGT
jgi:sec-independent protein translocase protein TatC